MVPVWTIYSKHAPCLDLAVARRLARPNHHLLSVCLTCLLAGWLADWLTGSGGMVGVRCTEGEGDLAVARRLARPNHHRQRVSPAAEGANLY